MISYNFIVAPRAFADIPLRYKGLIVVAIPVVALLFGIAVFLYMQVHEREADRWVHHTEEVNSELQNMLSAIVDAETATRAYLLAHDPAYLGPYEEAARRIPAILADLQNLVRDNPPQSARLENVKPLVWNRLERLLELHSMVNADLPDLKTAIERSKTAMDQLRAALGEMKTEEERLMAERIAHAERLRLLTVLFAILAGFAGLLGGILGARVFTRGIVDRVNRLTDNARRLAAGEPLVPAPAEADEIGNFSRMLVATGELLDRRERELRDTKNFLEHLVETSPTVIFQQDPLTLAVTYVSGNVTRLFGYTPAEIMSDPGFWFNHIHPEDREQVRQTDRRALEERWPQMQLEYRFERKDRSYVWLQSFVRIEYDEQGNPGQFLGHRLDITARKQAEMEVVERQVTLDAANKELETFSYSVSHDLRAPLRSIDGFSLALMEDYADKLDSAGRNYIERVRAATQRMGQLIDDLLNLSRVTRAQMQRGPVDLSDMAESVAGELRQSMPDHRVEFLIRRGITANADPGLLRVVLENLLGNAWKFTSKQPRARIEFGAFRQPDGGEVYFVRDNGAGFDPAYAGKLFGAFQRLHAVTDYAGTGIGLATVQRIIHRHGGHIWAEGATGEGATFYFTLTPHAMPPRKNEPAYAEQ